MTTLLLLGVAFAVLAAGLAGWLAYQMLLQNGRILRRLERLEEEARAVRDALEEAAESARLESAEAERDEAGDDGEPAAGNARARLPGLSARSVVPDFELATPDGGSLTLWEWRGRTVLLLFVDPACVASRDLLARLGPLPAGGDVVVLLVGTGDPAANRRLAAEHGVDAPVLVQEEREVARVLRADGTPAAIRVDPEGRTVGSRALGTAAVLALVRAALDGRDGDAAAVAAGDDASDHTPLYLPSVPTHTRLRRTGLRPGETAPAFRLPAVDGGERALADFLGQPLLLVFTDPHCAPCRRVLPELERLHREGADSPGIVAISRGGDEATRAHTAGITFPVLRQRHWEVSRDYAMFATPVAYLIDADGMIASPPALGAAAILALADPTAASRAASSTPALA